MTRRTLLVRLPLGLLALLVLLAVAGSVRDWHVVTVTRTTDADPDVMWEQWADVEARPDWDRGLEAIEGDFVEGGRGTVTVEGQGEVDWEIVELTERESYTDRFSSLAWTTPTGTTSSSPAPTAPTTSPGASRPGAPSHWCRSRS